MRRYPICHTVRNSMKGFTLIEVIVFIVVLGIASSGLFVGMQTILKNMALSRQLGQASLIAQTKAEEIIQKSRQNLTTSPSNGNIPPFYYEISTSGYNNGICTATTCTQVSITVYLVVSGNPNLLLTAVSFITATPP
ncbi:MAG: prepilin-type N-terminal cleavage/methylation domain-containing protein [Magnetococcales bacterium]|nr:prepilin-type N-terminal cleavage/methylation domain-containing protein [Magnetococcales bacterium]